MSGYQTDFRSVRVLLVSAKPHVVQVMRHVLTINGVLEIEVATSAQFGVDLLTSNRFGVVFCDDSCGQIDGRSFAFTVRRNAAVLNPMVPLFLVCSGPRQRDVELARDTGYSDVLTRPVSAATIARKLKQVTEYPRPFIAASDFFGPDRRAARRPEFHGKERRKRSARKVKIAAPSENLVEI
jgi:CheY-like chemotaxis protein